VSDRNNVIGRADETAGSRSQGRVTGAGAIRERVDTDGGVVVAGTVELKGVNTDSCVVVAASVGKEAENASDRVAVAIDVAKERVSAGWRCFVGR